MREKIVRFKNNLREFKLYAGEQISRLGRRLTGEPDYRAVLDDYHRVAAAVRDDVGGYCGDIHEWRDVDNKLRYLAGLPEED